MSLRRVVDPRLLDAFGGHFIGKGGASFERDVVLCDLSHQAPIGPPSDIVAESGTLAQLQHTNIVPIYSFHRSGSYQAVCMPYFGPCTLAHVLADIRARGLVPEQTLATLREDAAWAKRELADVKQELTR